MELKGPKTSGSVGMRANESKKPHNSTFWPKKPLNMAQSSKNSKTDEFKI